MCSQASCQPSILRTCIRSSTSALSPDAIGQTHLHYIAFSGEFQATYALGFTQRRLEDLPLTLG